METGACESLRHSSRNTILSEALMNSTHVGRKQKIKHELREMLELFVYLAFFFCSIALCDMLLLRQYTVEYLTITFAVINALVITKVIMIGEYTKLGRRHEDKALLISAAWKAFVFGLLVFAFHVVEEVIKRLIHGADSVKASHGIRFEQFAGRAIIVFCVCLSGIPASHGRRGVPVFSFRERWRIAGSR